MLKSERPGREAPKPVQFDERDFLFYAPPVLVPDEVVHGVAPIREIGRVLQEAVAGGYVMTAKRILDSFVVSGAYPLSRGVVPLHVVERNAE